MFQVGDKVKIVRKAQNHEKGWPAVWLEEMDNTVGKIGEIIRGNYPHFGPTVEIDGQQYFYPEFVLEPVETPSFTKFKIGDKVRVIKSRQNFMFSLVPATVVSLNDPFVRIKTVRGSEGGFYPKNLEYLPKTARKATDKKTVFTAARGAAITIAKRAGKVNIDLVQSELLKDGFNSEDLGNAAGVLFRGKNWRKVGTTKSTRKTNHSREITEWEYIGA
jgi:hypothetical protein